MFDPFRLRYHDQWTAALVLSAAGLMCMHSAAWKQETFEPKQYRFHVDLDTATHAELQTLPGIGPVLARGIIQYRDQHAPIQDFDEILNVKGIGIKKHNTIKHFFTD